MEKEKENKTLLQSDITATSYEVGGGTIEKQQCQNDHEEKDRPSSSRLDKATSNDEKACGDDENVDELMKSVTPGLSKNQQKKLRKLQKWEEYKSAKRKQEKEKKRAKRQALRDAGIEVAKKRKISMKHPEASSMRVALDLSFNHLMTEKISGNGLTAYQMKALNMANAVTESFFGNDDQRKVVKQVLRSYSMNRQAKHPLQLYLTNFDQGNRELYGKFSSGYKTWDVHIAEENHLQKFDKSEIVYLSSDSSNILQELDDKKVYIIGGIVDHNAHKGMCFNMAEEAGIGHARLPIDEYIKLEGRKVLPINHVFEILLHFVEFSDWEKAFYHVIPKRKGLTSHQQISHQASEGDSPKNSGQFSSSVQTESDNEGVKYTENGQIENDTGEERTT